MGSANVTIKAESVVTQLLLSTVSGFMSMADTDAASHPSGISAADTGSSAEGGSSKGRPGGSTEIVPDAATASKTRQATARENHLLFMKTGNLARIFF